MRKTSMLEGCPPSEEASGPKQTLAQEWWMGCTAAPFALPYQGTLHPVYPIRQYTVATMHLAGKCLAMSCSSTYRIARKRLEAERTRDCLFVARCLWIYNLLPYKAIERYEPHKPHPILRRNQVQFVVRPIWQA